VPAVRLLEAVGPSRLAVRLKSAGARLVLPPGEAPGLAIGLGGAGLRLVDLAGLYAALASGGEARPLRYAAPAAQERPRDGVRLLDPVAAWYVAEALAGAPPPAGSARGRIAFKTGTSYGYRDAWAAGYDGRHTVAVWVGRPDGAPLPGLTGLGTAAPLLFDVFARVAERRAPLPGPPAGAFLARNGELPPGLRRFHARGDLPALESEPDALFELAFPPDGARLEGSGRGLVLKADGGALPLTWFVDGRPIGRSTLRRETSWHPPGSGLAQISVVDATGLARTARVRLD